MAEQSREELLQHLTEQLRFLRTSAKLFDQGDRAEAKRLATTMRVLLHDTAKSHSLLGQLGLKDRLFLDTAQPRSKTFLSGYAALALVAVSRLGGSSYIPSYHITSSSRLPFDSWWNAAVIADMQGHEISRRELVLALANKDGGAHIDPKLDLLYAEVTRGRAMGSLRGNESHWEALPDIALASVRQIAQEVLASLDEEASPPTPPPPPETITIGTIELEYAPDSYSTGRNDPCPCGSGKKFKKCHGGAAGQDTG